MMLDDALKICLNMKRAIIEDQIVYYLTVKSSSQNWMCGMCAPHMSLKSAHKL